MSAERSDLSVCVDLLGPLRLRVDGRVVEVPGVRRRALLALLALESGRVISTERLVDSLWPDESPVNAVQALYSHVFRLRSHLGAHADRLERQGSGYRLTLEPDELDVDAARRLAAAVTAPGTSPVAATELARSALALWRGRPLEEFGFLPALEVESVGLHELRLQLVDELLEARLGLSDRTVTVDAAAAAAASPLRERTALLHIEALARDGRTAEAMAAAQSFRRRLVDETGLDPSQALAELEQSVAAGLVSAPAQPYPAPASGALARVARPDGPLIGRRHDREEVLRLLGNHAAVTITGPGGVGKSRLALDIAAEPGTGLPTDVVVIDLAAVDRTERVCQAVASTLDLRTSGEVRPSDIAAALAGRELLLVLDNCEHLPSACRDLVGAVRRGAPGVRVLATSRTTMHVAGEYVVRLQPLPVPRSASDLDALRRQPGVRAFVEHARRRRGDFELTEQDAPDLVEVLHRLDGLPLGIELAARQVVVMPLRAMRERLDRALDLAIGREGPEDDRQRTLRVTIDSSYRLLDADEQRLLRAIAPFPGGVDLATAEVLARDLGARGDPLDLLHRLVDASLLVADPTRGRYRLLFTVRAFLLDEGEARGERAETDGRFLDRCLAIAEDMAEHMYGPEEADTDRRLRAELDNFRAARDSARTNGRDDVLVGITLAANEMAIWRDLREVRSWALELADQPTLAEHPRRVAIMACAADAARFSGDLDRAEQLAEEAVAAAGADPDPLEVHRAWSALGAVAHFRGDFATARETWRHFAEVWPRESGAFLASAALASAYGGDRAAARELLDRAHAAVSRSGCGSHAAFAAYVEGELRATERVEESIPFYLEAIERSRGVGASFVDGVADVALASARTRTGDVSGAAGGFAHLIDYWRRNAQSTQLWTTARNAAGLLSSVGRARTAGLLLICADAAPGAAAVGPAIARHSGRAFTPISAIVDEAELAELRREAMRLGAAGVLDRAVEELRELAGVGIPAPVAGPASTA